MFINGILLLYDYPLCSNAATILEHINSFSQHSCFKIWSYNVIMGFPDFLRKYDFKIILLHYSCFGFAPFRLDNNFMDYLFQSKNSYKVAYFQDECYFCHPKFDFINEYGIDCIYTLLEPQYFKDVYLKYTKVPKLIYNLPGYVSRDLVAKAKQITKPEAQREIDVGYRGRELPWYLGKGALEKANIAIGFLKHAADQDLRLDIETNELKRIYGGAWLEFIGNCRAVLGVEAGVSIFDINDTVRPEYERLIALNPNITLDEISNCLLDKWENNIYYRTISPRHFEASALHTCQILFEGNYSGIMKPMVHYIPLKKDFSNFDEVIYNFRNVELRRHITENAYRDLIHSGQYSYENYVRNFDEELITSGLRPNYRKIFSIPYDIDFMAFKINYITYKLELKLELIVDKINKKVTEAYHIINRISFKGISFILWIKFCEVRQYFPGKRFLYPFVKPLLRKLDRWWVGSLSEENSDPKKT